MSCRMCVHTCCARTRTVMRGGTAQIEETKAQIADLQERLRDKEVALTALRNATSAGAAGAGAGATASYKAEIKSLRTLLAPAHARWDVSPCSALFAVAVVCSLGFALGPLHTFANWHMRS